MKPSCISSLLYTALFFPTEARSNSTGYHGGQPIIIDTDIMSDVDDVGSLAVANVLHNCGLADLRGALCTHYGNGEVPVAAIRPLTNETFLDTYKFRSGEFASKVAYNWPRTVNDASTTPEPVDLYRRLLSSAEDASLHIISIGFLTNLAALLESPADSTSPLAGPALISAKVSELITMGGRYPSGWEYNFGGADPESTAYVLAHWPPDVPITYSGYELGKDILSGRDLAAYAPPDSPVLAAYQWYVGRCGTVRESWDPITTLYGVLGLEGFERVGVEAPLVFANEDGYNRITSTNGSNAWMDDSNVTNQHYLRLADGVTNSSVALLLNQFYIHDPNDERCFGW